MKRILLLCLLLSSALSAAPKTVRDFYMLLPSKYFEVHDKREHLKTMLLVEDTRNGYLSTRGDAGQSGLTLALFKRPDASYLIGVATEGEQDCRHYFLRYRNDVWTDVSRDVVPGWSSDHIYVLPRTGTTVQVFQMKKTDGACQGKGAKLYNLTWRNGRFTR